MCLPKKQDLFDIARTAAVMMLECCEKFATSHNLQFSTDPAPEKSKSKCIFICGKQTRLRKPDNLTLFGAELPRVTSANRDHLFSTSLAL